MVFRQIVADPIQGLFAYSQPLVYIIRKTLLTDVWQQRKVEEINSGIGGQSRNSHNAQVQFWNCTDSHFALNIYRVGSHVVSVRIHCTEKWRTSFHTDVLSKRK